MSVSPAQLNKADPSWNGNQNAPLVRDALSSASTKWSLW
jgi:hypothetical protein